MKLHALLFTTLLGALTLADAQTDTPEIQAAPSPTRELKFKPKEPKPNTGSGVSSLQRPAEVAPKTSKTAAEKDPNMNADSSVTLSAGRLELVVREIERRIQHWAPKPASGDWVMPNVLYSGDTFEATVPGALTLRGVSPLQAVTLAAAAAGCTLEPIYATKEEPSAGYVGDAIIGYRVVHEKPPGYWKNAWSGVNAPTQVQATSTPKSSYTEKTVPGKSSSPSSGNSARNAELAYAAEAAANVAKAGDPFGAPAATVQDINRTFVRVYALGSILTGSKDEISATQIRLQELVTVALEKSEGDAGSSGSSGLGGGGGTVGVGNNVKNPDLSFHLDLRALIVKGTAAQHEIVEQVIKALKENEASPASARKP